MLLQVNDGVDEVEADGEYRAQLQFGWRRRVQVLRQRLLRVGSVKANEPARINAVVVVSEPSTKAAHNYSVLRVSAKHLSSTAWFRSASIITVVSKHSRRSTRSRRSDRAKLEMRAYLQSVAKLVTHSAKFWNFLDERRTTAKKNNVCQISPRPPNQCWSLFPVLWSFRVWSTLCRGEGGKFYLGLGCSKIRQKRSSVSLLLKPIVRKCHLQKYAYIWHF